MQGRLIVLGVSGGIAAYKAAYLTRLFLEEGAQVRVIMTPSAREFIGPQTFAGLTGSPVVESLFGQPEVSPHTTLGQAADAIVVAPATTATLARIAHGIAGDPLVATVLASEAPLVVAPAMHTEMWEHPATRESISVLRSHGHTVVGPDSGDLAGGDVGPGRMVEPEAIVAATARAIARAGGDFYTDRKVVVTAGGTREPIDPVRFVGNRSSGTMGHAIASAAARRGADVTLVTTSALPAEGCRIVEVETAHDMAAYTWEAAVGADLVILSAAVADFRPKVTADSKLRRADGVPEIVLETTENILAGVVEMDPRPFVVGFAAQAGSLDEAFTKAETYGVDLLVANDVSAPGSGFGTLTNAVTIITPEGEADAWPLLTKKEVAERLLERAARAMNED